MVWKRCVMILAATVALNGCNHASDADDGQTAVIAVPKEYTPAEKAAIQATFPAPYNTADLAAGEKQFNKCRSCHTIAEGAMNMTGPNLFGLFGRHAGTGKGYTYSDAMKAHDVIWDFGTLDTYLNAPQQVVRGTKMGYQGIQNETDRHNVIAYLKLETTPAPTASAPKTSATSSQ